MLETIPKDNENIYHNMDFWNYNSLKEKVCSVCFRMCKQKNSAYILIRDWMLLYQQTESFKTKNISLNKGNGDGR